ncbi:MAG TPA: cell division protein FtsA [Candidatus Onthocola stercorigallinarum]|nr:cell division protein FtsA [Candidatus Onthocola stercorigallinarum]
MRKIIASLDIGSHTIKLVVGEIVKNKLNILACVDTPARGIKKGFIVNPESAIEALADVFKKSEEQIGLPIKKVIVSVPSNGIDCFLSEGYTSVTNPERVITSNDLVRSLQAAVYNKVLDNQELVTILPTKFLVNDTVVTDLPLGMKAEKLKVKAVVVTVPKKNVTPIIRCLEKIGVNVVDVTIGALGDYYEFRDNKNSSEVGAVINIGASKTTVSIFNKGIITASEIIDIGGDNIDYDLGYVYKINRKDSLYIKENIALADKNMAQASESVIVEDKNGDKIKINQYSASEIVMSRLEEILNLAKKQINLLTKKQISYIIITGGVTETTEFKDIVSYIFKDATVGNVLEIGARCNKYATSVGLIKYYDSRLRLRNRDFSIFSIEEQENLSGIHKKVNINDNSILGKLFGYFFDN